MVLGRFCWRLELGFGMLSADFGAAGCWARPILKVKCVLPCTLRLRSVLETAVLMSLRFATAVVHLHFSALNALSQVHEDGLLLKE